MRPTFVRSLLRVMASKVRRVLAAAILTNGTEVDQVLGMRPISEAVIELYRRYRSTPPAPTAAQTEAR